VLILFAGSFMEQVSGVIDKKNITGL